MNVHAVLPETHVVKIGGQSIIDRGPPLLTVLDEIAQAHDEGIQVLVTTGGGTRARHVYALASELKLPTGVLSALGARVPVQNARIVQTLLAARGGVYVEPDDVQRLPEIFRAGCIPIMGGMAPYAYWEMRDPGSRIPPHRTDAGTWLLAEYLGVPRCLYVKDEDGLYDADPKTDRDAEFIPWIGAAALAARDIADMVIERVLLDYLPRARHCHEIQVVNGLRDGATLDALRGVRVGSFIVGGG